MNNFTVVNTIRHGETDYNKERRYAGTIDVPLNAKGIEDTKDIATEIIAAAYDVVVTSALRRTIETARILLGNNIEIVQSELCNERNYGHMQGMTEHEVKLIRPPIKFLEAGNDYHSLNPPNGEIFEELRNRAYKFYQFIMQEYEGLNILVISHGTFLQQFHGLIRGENWIQSLETWVHNLEYTTFQLRGTLLLNEKSVTLQKRKQSSW